MIRILLVDDSEVVREMLRGWFQTEKDLEVVGEAEDGASAVELVKTLSPDLVIMDILMPKMNGLEATEIIMAEHPVPILVFSAVANNKEANIAFEAISRGALDVMAKRVEAGKSQMLMKEEMIKKVRILSRVPVIRHPRGKSKARGYSAESRRTLESEPVFSGLSPEPGPAEMERVSLSQSQYTILGIGASTGGPKALCEILRFFPKDFPAPIVVVQHIADTFMEGMASWLSRESKLLVKIAVQAEKLKPATVYLAPPGLHLLVRNSKVELSNQAPVNNCKPSVDVLFYSLAESYGPRTVAVLLTGMGDDGAKGMKKIHERGGKTIVQDEKSSIVFGMPASAIELDAVDEVVPLERIPELIFQTFMLKKKGRG